MKFQEILFLMIMSKGFLYSSLPSVARQPSQKHQLMVGVMEQYVESCNQRPVLSNLFLSSEPLSVALNIAAQKGHCDAVRTILQDHSDVSVFALHKAMSFAVGTIVIIVYIHKAVKLID